MVKNKDKGGGVAFDTEGVAFSSGMHNNLPKTQRQVLTYLVVDGLSAMQISKKRNTSVQAVRNVIRKLRAKGIINNLNHLNTDVSEKATPLKPHPKDRGGYSNNYPNKYRLHGQNITIKILKTSKKYWKILNSTSQKTIKSNTIQLYRNKLVIYSNTSFYNDDVDECFNDSDEYWTQFFRILENELNITIVKLILIVFR